ncbi:MAG: hypothetical protein LBD38_04785 [Streptococcaceae bacterium]|nr:hypothetical protein [Streptococcaceae bacterium]
MELLIGKKCTGHPIGFREKIVGTILSIHEKTVVMEVNDFHALDRETVIDKQNRVLCAKTHLFES